MAPVTQIDNREGQIKVGDTITISGYKHPVKVIAATPNEVTFARMPGNRKERRAAATKQRQSRRGWG